MLFEEFIKNTSLYFLEPNDGAQLLQSLENEEALKQLRQKLLEDYVQLTQRTAFPPDDEELATRIFVPLPENEMGIFMIEKNPLKRQMIVYYLGSDPIDAQLDGEAFEMVQVILATLMSPLLLNCLGDEVDENGNVVPNDLQYSIE